LPTQAYHDITSHYNAYFNANEKIKNTMKTVESTHKDNFKEVIAVYSYNDSKDFAASANELDDAIKRSTQAIQLHTVANWTDDHFLLIGKASYLKGDYDKAQSSFKYITTEFKEGVDYVKVMKTKGKKIGKYVKAKKKKKAKPEVKVITNTDGTKTLEKVDKRPEVSIWIHTPARSKALVWLIKTYTRQKKYTEAASVITYVRSDDLFYKNFVHDLDLADADLQVSRGAYKEAIEPLNKYLAAKKVKKRKKLKVRPLFVLAQCYELSDSTSRAVETYKKVLKSRPDYDMEFYAKLKMAKLGRKSTGSSSDIKALLARMAKDSKYKDYWDQVYYELAIIALNENDKNLAIKNLNKSVLNSTTNDAQRALSYLKLAEINYGDENYVTSKFYYDSTLTFMSKNDTGYYATEIRNKVLDNLVKQLNIIAYEDSLQRLAKMPADERARKIKSLAAKFEEEEEAKKSKADADASKNDVQLSNNDPKGNPQQAVLPGQQATTSSWYFYNTTAKAGGYNTFIQKWGRRTLEDNWRRKNKASVITYEDDAADKKTQDSTSTDAKVQEDDAATGTLEEQMLAALPLGADKIAKSDNKMIDAYYNVGIIYKDELENYGKATKTFEELNSRFPTNKLLLESWYNLYLLAQKQKDANKADMYKNMILQNYPESVIAKVLRNPNYLNESKQKELAINAFYQNAYEDYKNNMLDSAWYKCSVSNVVFKPNTLAPKFELLSALVLGKQHKLEEYTQALNKIVSKTTDTEVKATAQTLLSLLNKSSLPMIDLSKDVSGKVSDSLNALLPGYTPPVEEPQGPSISDLLMNSGKPDTATKTKVNPLPVALDTSSKENSIQSTARDTLRKPIANANNTPAVMQEDTTSSYKRTDNIAHYFLVYITDPTVTQAALSATIAQVDAYNSSTSTKKLTTKQIMVDSKTKLINVRQFSNREEGMDYYKVTIKQTQLLSELKPEQYRVALISSINFGTLLTEKDIDAYLKFFNRVYTK
jgi:tetratricopeptide (TPR) repeat protein